jgi:hypothetical protein
MCGILFSSVAEQRPAPLFNLPHNHYWVSIYKIHRNRCPHKNSDVDISVLIVYVYLAFKRSVTEIL